MSQLKTENDSKERFSELETKLIYLQQYLNYINYISNKTSKYFKSVVESSYFLYVSYINARKLLIIDLNKLLNHKENNNLVSFLNSLLKNYSNLYWSHSIEISELRSVKKELQDIIKSDLYVNIKNFRDKFYAHDDPDKLKFRATISMEDIENLVKKLHDIYNKIKYSLSNETIKFVYNENYGELQNLKKFDSLRKYIYVQRENQMEIIPVSELMKILRS